MVYRIPSFTFPPGMQRRGGMPGNFQRFSPYGGFRYSTPTLGDFGRYSSAGPAGPAPTMAGTLRGPSSVPTMAMPPRLGGMTMNTTPPQNYNPATGGALRGGGGGAGIGPAGTGPGMRGGYMGRNYGGMPGAGGPAYRGMPFPRGLLGMPFGGRFGGYGGGFPGFAAMNPMARFYSPVNPHGRPTMPGNMWGHLTPQASQSPIGQLRGMPAVPWQRRGRRGG